MTTSPGDPDRPHEPGAGPGWEAAGTQPVPEQPPYQQPYQQGYGQPYPAGPYPPPGQAGYPEYPVAPPSHGLAVAAMVVGIVCLALACGYGVGLLGSPVAWYLGRRAMREIDASQGRLGGRGMAQAGFVLGVIGTVLLGLLLVALVGVIAISVGGGISP